MQDAITDTSISDNENTELSIKLTSDVTESIEIAAGKTVTIDLNGWTLSNNEGKHTIWNEGTLYIKDSVGTGKVLNNSGKAALVNLGTANLEGGEFAREGASWYVIKNHGTMTIKDGVEVDMDDTASSLIANGWYNGSNGLTVPDGNDCIVHTDEKLAVLTIEGGNFSGGMNTVKNDDYGKLIVKDGTFRNTKKAAILNWNEAEIHGGDFLVEDYHVIALGSYGNNADKGKLVITGGTFTAAGTEYGNKIFGQGDGGDATKATLNITGGVFDGTFNVSDRSYAANTTITGGIYTDSSILKLAPNMLIVKYADVYGVENEAIVVAQAAAYNGEAINVVAAAENTIVNDVPEGVTIVNNSGNTIIINGVAVKPDTSYTVPVTPAAAPLSAKYFVISGNNQQWTAGDLEFKLNSKDVVKVLIDGVEVEFTVAEDGTVTIASAVIEALESGTHEIEFVYADGSCKTVFTVK